MRRKILFWFGVISVLATLSFSSGCGGYFGLVLSRCWQLWVLVLAVGGVAVVGAALVAVPVRVQLVAALTKN